MNSALPFRASCLAILAALLAAVPGTAEDGGYLTLQQYIRQFPDALKGISSMVGESPIAMAAEEGDETLLCLDPDEVLEYCAAQQQSPVLEADANSSDEASESLKRKLRDLWQKLGYRLYTQYLAMEGAQGSLQGMIEMANEAEIKKPSCIADLKIFAQAAAAFEAARAGTDKHKTKKAAKKLTDAYAAALTAYQAVLCYHDYPKQLVNEKRTANDMLPTLAKCRELWDNLPAELTELPGVKEYVAKQKESLVEMEAAYKDGFQSLIEACFPFIGDDPKVYAEVGLKVSRHDQVLAYLNRLRDEAAAIR